jgi:hypothetical protein
MYAKTLMPKIYRYQPIITKASTTSAVRTVKPLVEIFADSVILEDIARSICTANQGEAYGVLQGVDFNTNLTNLATNFVITSQMMGYKVSLQDATNAVLSYLSSGEVWDDAVKSHAAIYN